MKSSDILHWPPERVFLISAWRTFLFGLACFGLVTSSVFAGMVVWAVPGYLRERRAALAALAGAAWVYAALDAAEAGAWGGTGA